MRASRRGVSEIVGALLAISAMIIVGGILMYYYGQMASTAEERLAAARENVRIIPVVANGTLYASLINVGSQPVEIAYIILYNVSGEPQPILVENTSIPLAPGAPGALIHLIPETPGKYEIVAVSSLGSVFRWDPEATGGDGVLDVPGDLTSPPPGWDPGDFLGPILSREYGNMTLVNATTIAWEGIDVLARVYADSGLTTYNYAFARLTVQGVLVYNETSSRYSRTTAVARVEYLNASSLGPVRVELNATLYARGSDYYPNRVLRIAAELSVVVENPTGYYLAVSIPGPEACIQPENLPRWSWSRWAVDVEGGDWDLVDARLVIVAPPGSTVNATVKVLVGATGSGTGRMQADACIRVWGAPILLAYLQP